MAEIMIYTITGKPVFEKKAELTQDNNIPAGNLAPGTYIIRIITGNQFVYTGKIIKIGR
jgi:hypothetical protein